MVTFFMHMVFLTGDIVAAQSIVSGTAESFKSLESFIPWLRGRDATSAGPQLLYWLGRLLSKGAEVATEEASKHRTHDNDRYVSAALKLFRLWAVLPDKSKEIASDATEIDGPSEPASAASTWKSYYDILTLVLQDALMYDPPESGDPRPQLAIELQYVQEVTDKSLMREEKFPGANAQSPLIESWVEQVVRNWEVLCGPQWSDLDVGDGGQDAVGRRVLDVSTFLLEVASLHFIPHILMAFPLGFVSRRLKNISLTQHPPPSISCPFLASRVRPGHGGA